MKSLQRLLKLTVLFVVLYWAVLLFCFATAFSATMYRFDHPEASETLIERFCGVLTAILIEPYFGLAEKLGLHNRLWDRTGVLLNSLLWGAALSLLLVRLRKPKSLEHR